MVETSNKITAVRLRDERSGKLTYEFRVPDGNGITRSIPVAHDSSISQIHKELRAYTTITFSDRDIKALVENTELPILTRTETPGWKGLGGGRTPSIFVARDWMIPADAPYRLTLDAGLGIETTRGSASSWVANVAPFAAKSNYVTFAICAALAAPLIPFSGLPENPIFNFFGGSTVGKTTAAMVGQTVANPAKEIQRWNNSDRRFDEIAAEHNHLLLVLNAIELVPVAKRSSRIREIAHLFPEGRSAGRSKTVQETLPNLSWQGVMLSTSNYPASVTAADWADQDLVRFIDIPVPAQDVGGIFDCLDTATASEEASAQITLLEKQLEQSHGVLLKPWIEYLATIDLAVEVRSWMDEFIISSRPKPGLETRIANKFAIIYAAGMLAINGKLIDFRRFKTETAVDLLYARSVAHRMASTIQPNAALAAFKQVVESKDGIFEFDLTSGGTIQVNRSEEMIGLNCEYKGQSVLALRRDGMIEKFGRDGTTAILDFATRTKVLIAGHGGKAAVQLTIGLKIGSKLSSRPRFHVLDADKLSELLEAI